MFTSVDNLVDSGGRARTAPGVRRVRGGTGEARVRSMNFGLALLATERELPIPAWGFGLIAFIILHLMLAITISIGKGRPHS